jgi:hypothetical protein
MKTSVSQGAKGKATEALVEEKHEVTALHMDSCVMQKSEKLSTVLSWKAFGNGLAATTKEGGEKSVEPEI